MLKYLWQYCFVIDPGHENISAHNIINKDLIILSKILKCLKISYHASVLSRNAFFWGGGGGDDKEEVHPYVGVWGLPPRKM